LLSVQPVNARSITIASRGYAGRLRTSLKSSSYLQNPYEPNKDILKNPNYIYMGMKLTIPMEEPAS
jgi:hypothetical protein